MVDLLGCLLYPYSRSWRQTRNHYTIIFPKTYIFILTLIPRDTRGKKHELINILIMTIYGILWGYTDFTNPTDFLKVHENYFNELLDLKNGTPSHDTLSNVFSIIDSAKFLNIFID